MYIYIYIYANLENLQEDFTIWIMNEWINECILSKKEFLQILRNVNDLKVHKNPC